MSIDLVNLDKEAFTCSEQRNKYIFGRRRFPPRFDPSQDTRNAKEKKVFLSSIVHLKSAPRVHMDFCGGVACVCNDRQVRALCFTDYVIGSCIKKFDIIVSSFVCISNFKGKEVVGGVAFLSFGKLDAVTCHTGILDHVTVKTLRIGAAVVLNECKIGKILVEPEMGQPLLCSRRRFRGKQLGIEVRYDDFIVRPMVTLVKTKRPATISEEIIITVQENDIDDKAVAQAKFCDIIAAFSQDQSTVNLFNDRGSVWHCDILNGFSSNDLNCSICGEELPLQEVIGHHATAGSDKNFVHAFCPPCLRQYKEQGCFPKAHYIPCPLCRSNFLYPPFDSLDRWSRLPTILEAEYARLMGLVELFHRVKT